MENQDVYEDISWIQLSDLHIGSPYYKWTDSRIKERFEYLFREKIKRVNGIIITGDLIHQGQFDNVNYQTELREFLTVLKCFSENIIIVPGNHDYKRDDTRLKILKDWKNNTKKNVEQDNYAQKLRGDFLTLKEIIEGFNLGITYITKTALVQSIEGLNIIALNTSVFAGQPQLDSNGEMNYDNNRKPIIQDDGNLWLCQDELIKGNKLRQDFPTIMIGHHTLNMFCEESKKRLIEFAIGCSVVGYFCGHTHKTKQDDLQGIRQYVLSGLFKGDYNIPYFSHYYLKKKANETVHRTLYVWKDEWEMVAEESKMTDDINEDNQLPNPQMLEEPFIILSSEISDGAIRMPYGKGCFNLYVSKDGPGSITVPHKHDKIDEITYVTKGKVIAFIDKQMKLINSGEAVKMPLQQFHGFLPASFPCEYLTIGVENNKDSNYASKWNDDILAINDIDSKIESGEYELEKYKQIIGYLKSSIMEVRWHAKNALNKRLVREDCGDNAYIREAVGTEIRPAIRSKLLEEQFFGLSIAYELGIDIAEKELLRLVNNNECFMISWMCAYYIIKYKRNIDVQALFQANEKSVCESDLGLLTIKYYQQCILMILQLLIKHDGSLLRDNYNKLSQLQKKTRSLDLDEIIMYFVMWYNSFTYTNEEMDFDSVSEAFIQLFGLDGKNILRGFTNMQDYEERYEQLVKCRKEGKLLEAVCAYFENRSEIVVKKEELEKKAKDRIEGYLRIIVSEKCNLSCVYCHHEGRIDELIGSNVKNNPDFDLRELLLKAKQLHFRKIKISGGEPLLYPNILHICDEFQNEFEDIGFTTNGTRIMALKNEFENIRDSKLSFNITLNSMDQEKYKAITGHDKLHETLDGIEYLAERGYSLKLNSVITSFNFDEMVDLISYAARIKVNIKLLDLFTVGDIPEGFKHVSIPEIKNEVIKKFHLKESDFVQEDDYLVASVMGINVLIPSRLYSIDCQHNCQMYPCAEGIFGIRIYEDYSCAKCFCGTVYRGNLNELDANIEKIRKELSTMRFTF